MQSCGIHFIKLMWVQGRFVHWIHLSVHLLVHSLGDELRIIAYMFMNFFFELSRITSFVKP